MQESSDIEDLSIGEDIFNFPVTFMSDSKWDWIGDAFCKSLDQDETPEFLGFYININISSSQNAKLNKNIKNPDFSKLKKLEK